MLTFFKPIRSAINSLNNSKYGNKLDRARTRFHHGLIAPLVKVVQELSAENADLKARLDAAGI